MKLEDIVKQKGLEIKKEEKKAKPSSSPSALGRRYFWDEDQEAPEKTNPISQPLDSNKPADRQEKISLASNSPFDKPVISQPLDSNKPADRQEKISLASNSPFDKPVISQPLDSNKPVNFNELVGDEKQFILVIFRHLEFQASRETLPITTDDLKKSFSKKTKAISNLIERLVGKKVLIVKKSARGNASWRIFSLAEKTFKEVREFNSISQSLASHSPFDKPVHWTGNEPYSNNLNSSSIKNNNNNEPTEPDFEIPENISALGISQKSLQAIVRDNFLSRDEVDSSLKHYSFDLVKNQVKLKSAQFFMGVLRNKTPYISSHFAQDEAKAMQAEIARIKQIQSDRAELAELKLREEFEEYKLKNPNFLDEVKAGNSFLAKSNSKILDEIAFGKFKEKINTHSQNENP
nr:hypothetical protein HAGR004_41770 [Bdellovibrio sp. HAGR004]